MFNISTIVMNDHDIIYRKIDDSGIYQIVKSRFGFKGYVDLRSVAGDLDGMEGSRTVGLVDFNGTLYYSTHPNYGY